MPVPKAAKTRAILAVLISAVLLGSYQPKHIYAQPESIEIEFWQIFSGTLGERIEALVGEFEQDNPGIDVNLVYTPYDAMLQSLLGAVAAGNPPAVAQIELTLTARLAADGALAPIESLISTEEAAALADSIVPSIREANSYNGMLYTIPMGYNSNVLYYNPQLLEAAGIDPETDLPRTWDELISIAQQLTIDENGDGEPEIWGYGFPTRAPWILEVRLWQSGAEIYNSDNSRVIFNSEEGLQTYQRYLELVTSGAALPVSTDTALNELADLFAAGRVAMFEQSSTAFFGIQDRASFEVGVSNFPVIQNEVYSMGGYNLGVFPQADENEQAAATAFALWWASPEIAAQWTAISNYTPGIAAAWDTETLQAWVAEDPRRAVAASQMPFARPRPNQADYPQIANLIADSFEATIAGQLDAETALAQAAEQANTIIGQ